MSLAEKVLKDLKAEKLTPESAPGLYEVMRDVEAELKKKKPSFKMPTFHVLPKNSHSHHPLVDALCNKPNAAAISRDHVILSKPLLTLLESEDLSKPISEELKGVLAHEMHHCANRRSAMAMSRLPVFALPVVAVAATYIYEKAHAKAKTQGDISAQNVIKNMDEASSELHDSLPPPAKEAGFFTTTIAHGKYWAAAAIGIGAGLLAARYGSRYHEFAADLFASKNLHDKEVMVTALEKITQEFKKSVPKHAEKEFNLMAETVLAHPSFEERAAHIRAH